MNFIDLIKQLDTEQLDGEEQDRFLSRKQALGKMSNFSKKLAVSALPLGAFAAFSNKAQAQSTDDLIDVLNFALTLEHLESAYYQEGIESGVVDSYGKTSGAFAHGEIFREIADHEADHVNFLTEVIGNILGGDPIERESLEFDFTGGQGSQDGPFDYRNDGATFLTLAQAFEDTGVRAYKGQAGAVAGNDLVLTSALRIHSVEARHAARVRQLRDLTGWISGGPGDQMVPDAAQAVYQGDPSPAETNTTQVVPVSDTYTSGDGDVDSGDIAEAWDEPLTMAEVNAIARLFIVDND